LIFILVRQRIKNSENSNDATERFEKILKAVEARHRFLAEHLELMPFQKEKERRLRYAGSIENRMVILRFMMDERLFELSQTCLAAKKSWEGQNCHY